MTCRRFMAAAGEVKFADVDIEMEIGDCDGDERGDNGGALNERNCLCGKDMSAACICF